MTSRAHLTSATISDYATSAKLEVTATSQQGGLIPVVSKTTSFTPGTNVDTWIEQTVTFVAPEPYLHFELSLVGNPNQVVSYVNFDIYSKPFDCVVPGGQAELFRPSLDTPFPCATTDLYNQIKSSTPPGAMPVWSTVPTHGFTQMTHDEAANAEPGLSGEDYYLFYKSTYGCYNADVSTAKITFKTTPTQVSLTSNQRAINCINQTSVDLTTQVAQSSNKVLWFTNDKHQGAPIPNLQAAPVGTYYAFYYLPQSAQIQCYSVDKAAVSAIFQVTGSTMCCNDPNDPSNQIPLTQTDVKIVAPAETYDLTTLIPANISIPPNVVIEWYTTPDHSGSVVSDPKHASPGKYYVFAHDLKNGCFNVPFSKSSVNVTKNAPQLAVRVALQGSFELGDWDIMRYDLQTYGNGGLLPVTTPYGGSETRADINAFSKMGGVVDWIKVEIRDAANPATMLESKSLLLKSSGAIVNVDGTSYPYFKVQANPIRIVIKHRNHLAIMSNPIQNFSIGVINYDFTATLSQASNELSGSPQMVQKNGIWCMWAGDINATQDLGVDASDVNQVFHKNEQAPVDVYSMFDLNMDGGVDANDSNLIYSNNLIAPISSLVNY